MIITKINAVFLPAACKIFDKLSDVSIQSHERKGLLSTLFRSTFSGLYTPILNEHLATTYLQPQ
jgi:hypothetical protein